MAESTAYGAGAARRKSMSPKDKMKTVMHEFKKGTLHSGGSGEIVTNPKQAIAIGISEGKRNAIKRKLRDS